MATTKTAARSRNDLDDKSGQWTDDEVSAMKAHAEELKAAKRRSSQADKDAEGEADLLAKLAELNDDERAIGERIHAIVKANAPELKSRTWYGMPAYAKDGKVVCHFQPGSKFGSRYSTFAVSDEAKLDEGDMWPVGWAIKKLTAPDEKKIAELVKKAIR